MARICVVTAGHLATCPRMTKAADALAAAGHGVRVVSTCHTPWAVAADDAMRATRSWRWRVVDYRRDAAPLSYLRSGVRSRACAGVGQSGWRASRVPFAVGVHAYARVHSELYARPSKSRLICTTAAPPVRWQQRPKRRHARARLTASISKISTAESKRAPTVP